MRSRRLFLLTGGAAAAAAALGATGWRAMAAAPVATAAGPAKTPEAFEFVRTDAQWRQMLSAAQYDVLRQEGTERPYSSPLNDEHRAGTFSCAGCKLAVFSSRTKFDSGTGWPSFYEPLPGGVGTRQDGSFGMQRTSVHCHRCGGHLGHVFDDGPKPTGLRYCMNGVAMTFAPGSA